MSSLILVFSLLLILVVEPQNGQFSTEILQDQKGDINCSLAEGRGVNRPVVSVYDEDQGSDLVNFDSFVECRRHFLDGSRFNRAEVMVLESLDSLAQIVAAKIVREENKKSWQLQTVFKSKIIGEKVFSTFVGHMKNSGINISNRLVNSVQVCPENAANEGILVVAQDDLTKKINIGHCESEKVEWWFYESI